jgi:hypothetical protein
LRRLRMPPTAGAEPLLNQLDLTDRRRFIGDPLLDLRTPLLEGSPAACRHLRCPQGGQVGGDRRCPLLALRLVLPDDLPYAAASSVPSVRRPSVYHADARPPRTGAVARGGRTRRLSPDGG